MLQFYCPSLQRGKNIIHEIYSRFINPENSEQVITRVERKDGKTIERVSYKIKDAQVYENDLNKNDSMIFDIEETDEEVLFKFRDRYMDALEDVLNPSTIACNRSPFSSKNLIKSTYKIPDEDLKGYSSIIKIVPQNELIKLVHISQNFMNVITKNKKQLAEFNDEKKRLGMKPKEYYHYKGYWKEYLKYVEGELNNNGKN